MNLNSIGCRPFSGPPDPPSNCSVVNQTTDSLEVECLPGFDGGLEQTFQLEVTDLQTDLVLANDSGQVPEFVVSNLSSLSHPCPQAGRVTPRN